MKKRLLPALLALAMVLTMLPMAAFAEVDPSTIQMPTSATEAGENTEALDQEGKYVAATGEGVYQGYTVTAWLWWAESVLSKLTAVNGKDTALSQPGTTRAMDAVVQLEGALKAYENSETSAKSTLDTFINATKAKFAEVTTLDCSGSNNEGLGLTNMGFMKYYTGVETLILNGNQITEIDGNALAAMAESLTKLEAIGCGITNAETLENAPNLTYLDLSENTDLANIGTLEHCTDLTTLKLNGCSSLEDAQSVAKLTNLETLDISGTGLTDLLFVYSEDGKLTKLKNLTATGLTLNESALSSLAQLVAAPGFDAAGATWDFGTSDDASFDPANLNNAGKAHMNKVVAAFKDKGTLKGLTEQTGIVMTAALDSLSVAKGDAADAGDNTIEDTVTFDAGTLEYEVKIPQDVKKVTITAAPAGSSKITKVLYGNDVQAELNKEGTNGDAITAALTNITVDANSVHVQIVVRKADDAGDYQVYVVKLQKQGLPSVQVQGTADGETVKATVEDDVATSTIDAAKGQASDKTATFIVMNKTAQASVVENGAATIGADKLQDTEVSVRVMLHKGISVRLTPAALAKVLAVAAQDTDDVTISLAKVANATLDGVAAEDVAASYEITVAKAGGNKVTDWGTLGADDILVTIPMDAEAYQNVAAVYVDDEKLEDGKHYHDELGECLVVRAPHLSTITIVNESVVPEFDITVDPSIENGTVTASAAQAAEGAEITLTVTPDPGYAVDKVTYQIAAGDSVTIENNNGYKFTMPDEAVTVSATFKLAANDALNVESIATEYAHYAKISVSDMKADRTYVIEVCNKAVPTASTDVDSLFVVTGATSYNFYTTKDKTIWVLEFGSSNDFDSADQEQVVVPTTQRTCTSAIITD